MEKILKMVAQRLALGLLTLFVVSLNIFLAVQLLPGDLAEAVLGQSATPETVAAIQAAVATVVADFPGTAPLVIGDISRPRGGHLRPHVSHQSGRDADIGYYFKGRRPREHFARVTSRNLDRARTWALIWALVSGEKVQYIFIDRRIQRWLRPYARDEAKVPKEQLVKIFGRSAHSGIIRHDRGHRNHMHVRFRSPEAVAAATLHRDKLPKLIGRTLPVYHRIRRGDTLTKIARRHRVRIKQLLKWNRLRKRSILRPGKKLIVGFETAKPAAGPEG